MTKRGTGTFQGCQRFFAVHRFSIPGAQDECLARKYVHKRVREQCRPTDPTTYDTMYGKVVNGAPPGALDDLLF